MPRETLRAAIEQSGGIETVAGLARRWGISKQRAHVLSKHPKFPEPIVVVGRVTLYLVSEADKFRDTVRPSGRPTTI